jgi:VWFA-related protein
MKRRAVSAGWIASVLGALIGNGLGAAAGRAQAVAESDSPLAPFTGRLDVVEVEVPVEVRNRNGEPVRGLTADDFRLFDQGEERPILRFEVVDLSISEPAPEAEGAAPVARAEPSRPRHLLLLFDQTFSNPLAILRARAAAAEVVLGSLPPSDLVSVATYSIEYGPRVLVTFTPDRAQVARALDSLSFDRAADYRALDPLRFMVPYRPPSASDAQTSQQGRAGEVKSEILQIGGETAEILAEVAERESRRYESSRVTSWTRGLAELGRHLASVEGRKQVLLFSEGFDSRLLLGRSDLNDPDVEDEARRSMSGETWRVDSNLRFGNTQLMSESARMVEELRRADCVVSAVDIGGLRAGGEGGRNVRGVGQDALFYIANESGGQLFTDTNDLSRKMRQMLERSEISYVLTFQAEDVPTDGSWRKLRVALKEGRGLRVVARPGWYAPRPYPELHPFERELLAADAIAISEPRDEIGLSLLAAPFRAGQSAAYVPVILEIDGPTLLAGMEAAGRVDLYAYATTKDGEFRSFFHRELRVDPARSRAARSGGGLKYYGHFELPPGDYVLRVLVRQESDGRMGTARLPLTVPDYSEPNAHLLPPFFFDPPGRWTLVRERGGSDADGAIVYPFVAGGDPFVPQAEPSFREGERPRFCLIAYHLGGKQLEVEAIWLTADGAQPIRLVAKDGVTGVAGARQWLGELDLAGMAAGEHRYRVAVVDRATGQRVATAEGVIRVEG